MTKRTNLITVICGRRGSGKTTFARKLATAGKKKILCIDLMDHPAYRDYGTMTPEMLPRWRAGNYRLFKGVPEDNLRMANQYAWNSTLILEDAARYINSTMPKETKALFVECKQRNQDIIIMYHALGEIPPYILKMYDILVLFPTDENVQSLKSRFYNHDKIMTAHRRLMAAKRPFHCEIISK